MVKQIVAKNSNLDIYLHLGWNRLSSHLIPEDPNLEVHFGELLHDILIIQDGQGFFQPQNPSNTINIWNSHAGYQLKLSENISHEFPGAMEYNRHLTLQPGWNLIPVISLTPIAAEDLNIQPPGSWEMIYQPN